MQFLQLFLIINVMITTFFTFFPEVIFSSAISQETMVSCQDGSKVSSINLCPSSDSTKDTINLEGDQSDQGLAVNALFKNKTAIGKEKFVKLFKDFVGYFHIKTVVNVFDMNLRIKLKINEIGEKFNFHFFISKMILYSKAKEEKDQEYFNDTDKNEESFASGDLKFTSNEESYPIQYSNQGLKKGVEEYRKYFAGILVLDDFTMKKESNDVKFSFDQIFKTFTENISAYEFIGDNFQYSTDKIVNFILDNLKSLLSSQKATNDLLNQIADDAKIILNDLLNQYIVPIFNLDKKLFGFSENANENSKSLYITSEKEKTPNGFPAFPLVFNSDINYHIVNDPMIPEVVKKWKQRLQK